MNGSSTTPIIIGITGKRDLAGKDGEVRRALHECFELLDQALPASRKILLSGLAAGGDTIAVEEALDRDGWTVIGILPFEPNLYAQDFSEEEDAKFRALLADPRIKWRALMTLTDPATQNPFTANTLARHSGRSNLDRANHYEQVGLYIAEQCALLIAVMNAAEQSERIGGTARIVDFRLRGAVDDVARRVIAQSRELGLRSVLNSNETNPVWLVDLAAANKAVDNSLQVVQLWRPEFQAKIEVGFAALVESLARRLGLRTEIDTEAPVEIEKISLPRTRDLIDSLYLARRIDTFNRIAGGGPMLHRASVAVEGTASEDASSVLRRIRSTVSTSQGKYKYQLQLTISALAGLFIAAILALELHSEFGWPIALYLFGVGIILLIYYWARFRRLQQYSEDYRAVTEALRVQLVWWDAGMVAPEYHVGAYFLVGTVGPLALVRAAVRHLINAALLERSPPAASIGAVAEWIHGKNGQINYFRTRIRERESRLSLINGAIGFLFVGSLGLAAGLLGGMQSWLPIVQIVASSSLRWAPAMIATIFLALVLSQLSNRAHGRYMRRAFLLFSLVPALLSGLLLAALVYHFVPMHEVARKLIGMLTVMAAAFAGAARYLTDSLAWEAELHSYQEALGMFVRASSKADFAAAKMPLRQDQKAILFELGRFALAESETWLRAHRIRPLEPMH